jgi:hypothetical protein
LLSVLNPARVRYFAKAQGKAKTDSLDKEFIEAFAPGLWASTDSRGPAQAASARNPSHSGRPAPGRLGTCFIRSNECGPIAFTESNISGISGKPL